MTELEYKVLPRIQVELPQYLNIMWFSPQGCALHEAGLAVFYMAGCSLLHLHLCTEKHLMYACSVYTCMQWVLP